MALPWVRLDSSIPSHDKILALIHDPSAKRWQAVASYMFSLAWAGSAGTDGHIPSHALNSVHGTKATAELLIAHGLWEQNGNGWHIRNYEARQELSIISEAKRAGRTAAARKANCVRHHGPDCGCWRITA